MRKFITGLVLVVMANCAFASSSIILRDPGDAWPWGAEIKFPWSQIEGTWVARVQDQDVFFQFLVVKSARGVNRLKITEFTSDHCRILSEGGGFEEDRVVKAGMIGPSGAFIMTVHVFRAADLKSGKVSSSQTDSTNSKTITVMSLAPMSGVASPRVTYQLHKIDSDPEAVCQKGTTY